MAHTLVSQRSPRTWITNRSHPKDCYRGNRASRARSHSPSRRRAASERSGDDPIVTSPGRSMAAAYESDSPTSDPLIAGESAWTRCDPRSHVADLVDLRLEQLRAWRDAPFAEGRARINTQAASTGRNRCSSAARGNAPTTLSISLPSRHQHRSLQPAPKGPFYFLKREHLQGESQYRYRDSNPGFRRERAAS